MSPLGVLELTRRTTKFATFPDLLVLHMKKFQLVNWMPTKLGELPNTSMIGIAHFRHPSQSA